MTLYQELPKLTIMSDLKHHFTDLESDAVRLDLFDLLNSCRTLDDLRSKISSILNERSGLRHICESTTSTSAAFDF